MRGDQAAVGAMEGLTGDLVAGGLPCQRGSSKKLCGVARCDRMECYPRRCVCAMSVSGWHVSAAVLPGDSAPGLRHV